MPSKPIKTDAQLRAWSNSPKTAKREDRPDGGSSLQLRRTPAGTISYCWRYTDSFTGKRKVRTLGTYPELSLSKARAAISSLKSQQKAGDEPVGDGSFGTVILSYFGIKRADDHAGAMRADTIAKFRARDRIVTSVLRDVFPHLGGVSVLNLSGSHVRRMATALKNARGKEPARVAVIYCCKISSWGDAMGLLPHDPLASVSPALFGLERTVADQRSRVPTRSELAVLMDLLSGATPTGLDERTRIGLRLLLGLGIRSGELMQAEWDEFTDDLSEWTVPESHTKGGRAIIYPIPAPLRMPLRRLRAITGHTGRVMGGMDPKALGRALKRLQQPTKTRPAALDTGDDRITPHDFRRAFSTHGSAQGLAEDPVIEAQLGHVVGSTVSRNYKKTTLLEPRKELLKRWNNALENPHELLAPDQEISRRA